MKSKYAISILLLLISASCTWFFFDKKTYKLPHSDIYMSSVFYKRPRLIYLYFSRTKDFDVNATDHVVIDDAQSHCNICFGIDKDTIFIIETYTPSLFNPDDPDEVYNSADTGKINARNMHIVLNALNKFKDCPLFYKRYYPIKKIRSHKFKFKIVQTYEGFDSLTERNTIKSLTDSVFCQKEMELFRFYRMTDAFSRKYYVFSYFGKWEDDSLSFGYDYQRLIDPIE